MEKYLFFLSACSLVCAHPLFADYDSCFAGLDDSLIAGLLYIAPENEQTLRHSSSTPPDDSVPGLLYMPSDAEHEVVYNSSEAADPPDDASPSLLYIPPEQGQSISQNSSSMRASTPPDDMSPGLLYIPTESGKIDSTEKTNRMAQGDDEHRGFFYSPIIAQKNSSHQDWLTAPARRGSLTGGFLYWKAKQDGLDYTNHAQSTMTTSDFADSSLTEPDFKWRPGFELAADYGFDRSFWSCGLFFIDYRGKAEGHKTAESNDGIFPVLSFSDSTLSSDFVTSAEMDWTLRTSILDADINYEYRASRWFYLVPSLALREVWIHEKVRAKYEGGTFSAGPDMVRLKSHFYGIGPLIGLMPKFLFGKGCYLYGLASVSYLWGWDNIKQKEAFLSLTTASLKKDSSRNCWNGNVSAGLVLSVQWPRFWGIKHFDLDVGGDYLFFTKQYNFEHGSEFSLPKRDKTLKLYGIHISLGAHF